MAVLTLAACDKAAPAAPAEPLPPGTMYFCPMDPEVRQDHPGTCPKCGMALEPEIPSLEDGDSPELRDFSRRFWWTLPLTAIVFVLGMFGHGLGLMEMATQSWVELLLATPVVLWAGAPFFVRGWQSVRNRSPNMWTLIALGTGAAYLYSVVATVAPGLFTRAGLSPDVYYEAVVIIIALILTGNAFEARAKLRNCSRHLDGGRLLAGRRGPTPIAGADEDFKPRVLLGYYGRRRQCHIANRIALGAGGVDRL